MLSQFLQKIHMKIYILLPFLTIFFSIQNIVAQLEWEYIYRDSLLDTNFFGRSHCMEVIETADSGFAIIGLTDFDPNPGFLDNYVRFIKTDAEGNVLTDTTYLENEPFVIAISGGICEGTDGSLGVIVFGDLDQELIPFVWKMNSDGEILWKTEINQGGGTTQFSEIRPLPDGGFRVIGEAFLNPPLGEIDPGIFDYDNEGNLINMIAVDFEGSYDVADILDLENNQAFIYVGAIDTFPTFMPLGHAFETDANNQVIWQRFYESDDIRNIHKIVKHEEHLFIGGTKISNENIVPFVGEIGNQGELFWSTIIELPDTIGLVNDFVISPNNEIIAIGSYDEFMEITSDSFTFLSKGFIATLDLTGNVEEIIIPETNISLNSMVQIKNECLVFSGQADEGLYLAKDCDIFSNIPVFSPLRRFLVYPNPSTETFTIDWENEGYDELFFQITDNLGRVILRENVTTAQTTIEVADYPKGNYWIQTFKKDYFLGAQLLIIE